MVSKLSQANFRSKHHAKLLILLADKLQPMYCKLVEGERPLILKLEDERGIDRRTNLLTGLTDCGREVSIELLAVAT